MGILFAIYHPQKIPVVCFRIDLPFTYGSEQWDRGEINDGDLFSRTEPWSPMVQWWERCNRCNPPPFFAYGKIKKNKTWFPVKIFPTISQSLGITGCFGTCLYIFLPLFSGFRIIPSGANSYFFSVTKKHRIPCQLVWYSWEHPNELRGGTDGLELPGPFLGLFLRAKFQATSRQHMA